MHEAGIKQVKPASSKLKIEDKFEIPDRDFAKNTKEMLLSLLFQISHRKNFVD